MAETSSSSPASPNDTSLKSSLSQLETSLEEYLLKKAPALPEHIKDVLVKFAPWIAIIGVVISIPAILAVLGLGALVTPLSFLGGVNAGFSFGIQYMLSTLILLAAVVVEAMAIPGLFQQSAKAWRLMYYSSLIQLVSNVVSLNIIGGLVGGLITFYLLFQVRSRYK